MNLKAKKRAFLILNITLKVMNKLSVAISISLCPNKLTSGLLRLTMIKTESHVEPRHAAN